MERVLAAPDSGPRLQKANPVHPTTPGSTGFGVGFPSRNGRASETPPSLRTFAKIGAFSDTRLRSVRRGRLKHGNAPPLHRPNARPARRYEPTRLALFRSGIF